jgi:hypothetical protein
MPTLKFLTLLSLLITISALNSAGQAGTGSIEGTVIDQRGRSVVGAWVSALGTRPLGGRVPGARTDSKGHFAIRSLDWDEYGVQACKEEDYVPCGFFYRGETKQVRVAPENPSVTAEIRLGLKGARIDWIARDASTGKPIPARFTFRPLQAPQRFVSGYFEPIIFIPASIDFSLEVSADGYKTWSYASQYNPPQPLRLAPGAHVHLGVNLEPVP